MQSVAYFAAIGAMLAAVKADSGVGQPGYCKDDSACEDNYVCISVQTTRSGIENVKQCLPYKTEGDVCSGTFAGLCPSFSTWKTAFQSISSVCAYQLPSGSDKCLNDTMSGSTEGYVSCVTISEKVKSKPKNFGVIYGCVDFDGSNLLYLKDSDNWDLSAQMNYSAIINEECVNPSNGENSDVVCSGRGTCLPRTSGGVDFQCGCNVGYSGTYCEKIVSNKCTLESQCQAGTCNLKTQECECDPGTTGDQCAYCDPTSSKACNGHGKCIAASSRSSGLLGTGSKPDSESGATTPSSDLMTGSTFDGKANNAGAPSTGQANNAGTPSTGQANNAGGTSTGQANNAGGTSTGQANNAGAPSTGQANNAGAPSTGQANNAGGTSTGQANNAGDSAGSTLELDSDVSTRFLMEMADGTSKVSSSGGDSTNVCECESGYTGDQCTRKVESGSTDSDSKPKKGNSSDAASMATSFILVASVVVVALLN